MIFSEIDFFTMERVPDLISREVIVSMAGLVKSFQFFQKYQQIIGIHSSQAKRMQYAIISKRVIFLAASAMYMFPTVAYLVFDTESIFDYGMAFLTTSSTTNSVVVYLIFVWKLENILAFIDICDAFITKSKCHSTHTHTH